MPIGNFSQLARFSDACGAEIPRWLRHGSKATATTPPRSAPIGLDVVTRLCDDLLRGRRAGAAFLHAQPGRAHLDHLAAARPLAAVCRCTAGAFLRQN